MCLSLGQNRLHGMAVTVFTCLYWENLSSPHVGCDRFQKWLDSHADTQSRVIYEWHVEMI